MVAAFPYPTGQGTQALVGELARGLSARGHGVHLVCYAHGAFSRPEPFSIHRTPPVPGYRRLRSGPDPIKPLLDAALALRAVQVIRNWGCSLVHAHNYEGALAGWLAARACRVPLVYHAHNLMEDELPSFFDNTVATGGARLLGRLLDRTVPRLADRVIALHQAMADALVSNGVEPERLTVIEPGIDVDFWFSGAKRERQANTVAYCGNLDAYQNLSVLFAAMHRVVRQVPGARLVIATPNDPARARRELEQAGLVSCAEVVFTPDATVTREVLRRCSLAVCPRTSWSGFPIKNINAAAAGCPLVACRGAGFGVEHERTGLLVPDDDAEALAGAVVQLLRDPGQRSMFAEAGREMARSRFSRDRMTAGVERVWRSLMDCEKGCIPA